MFVVKSSLACRSRYACRAAICYSGRSSGIIRSFRNYSNESQNTTYVALSGGVDSSVSALLLTQKMTHKNVIGVYMNNWSSTSKCQEENWNDVQKLCDYLNIERRRVNFEIDYWLDVFEPMLEDYAEGLTPNPDVQCNYHVKFGALLRYLKKVDESNFKLCTGHYARLTAYNANDQSDQRKLIKRPLCIQKDQSYYLSTVAPDVLKDVSFPLSNLNKSEVRQIAAKCNLPNATKPDSQGLCFVEQQSEFHGFRHFLAEYLENKPGPVYTVDDPSKIVGEHQGLWTHTIGQRASIPMPQTLYPGKWFVYSKDSEKNALIISQFQPTANAVHTNFHWHRPPKENVKLYAQYRSLQSPVPIASITNYYSDIEKRDKTLFRFEETRNAIAPGQYLVVYEEDAVIGSGVISKAELS